ncbi:unnamed protein product [Amoebophrya sp. A25]|nr:unnamed protein product [Amoebophrya sp. A25]|eukprot:GSA25T00001890001.1
MLPDEALEYEKFSPTESLQKETSDATRSAQPPGSRSPVLSNEVSDGEELATSPSPTNEEGMGKEGSGAVSPTTLSDREGMKMKGDSGNQVMTFNVSDDCGTSDAASSACSERDVLGNAQLLGRAKTPRVRAAARPTQLLRREGRREFGVSNVQVVPTGGDDEQQEAGDGYFVMSSGSSNEGCKCGMFDVVKNAMRRLAIGRGRSRASRRIRSQQVVPAHERKS